MRVSMAFGWLAGVLAVSAGAHSAKAALPADEAYFTLKAPRVVVQEMEADDTSVRRSYEMVLPESETTTSSAPTNGPTTGIEELDAAEVILDKILAIGRKIWNVVENNRPVSSFSTANASALPQGALSWQQLAGWQTPRSYVYRVTYENLYGIDVVDFSYRVVFTPGGSVAGRGQYLSNVTLLPNTIDVAWGYTFNANAAIVNTVNAGSNANPVAAMELLLNWSIETPLKSSKNSASYYVRGDGRFVDLTSGN